jgi:colanic acid/amylovoran biosynthesis protein
MEKRYIIIPGCCDLNRGDQALGWETCHIAQKAGFVGNYSILAEQGEPVVQSQNEGYEILIPALEHPSRKFSDKNNIVYNRKTKIKWGLIAIKDFIFSMALLNRSLRKYIKIGSKNSNLILTLNRFEEADAIFMKGGGLIQSHGGLISTYATYYRLYHIFLAEALGKSVYILPNSFGPFEGPLVKWMSRKALSKCRVVTAREKKSQEVVRRELGINVPCFPDLAFFLENGDVKKGTLVDRLNITDGKKIVALTMRPYRFPNSDNPIKAYEMFKIEMCKFIRWLYDLGYIPLIIEHTFAITSHENDGDCIQDVVAGLDSKIYRVLSDRSMNCKQLKSVYGCCDFIIGTRFHSMIFSLSNMIPGIAISYDGYKSIGIMKDMKLDDFVIDIADITSEVLQEKFNLMIDNEDSIKDKIKQYINESNKKKNELIQLLKMGD